MIDYFDFMGGRRGIIERYWLRTLGRIVAWKRAHEPHIWSAWTEIVDQIGVPLSAFLLDTSFYKPTTFVGPVRFSRNHEGFVKKFSNSSDVSAEKERASICERLADGFFRTSPIRSVVGSTVVYELVPHSGKKLGEQEFQDLVLGMAERSFMQGASTTLLNQHVDVARLRNWLIVDRMIECADSVEKLAEIVGEPVDICVAHGDCTPWNVFLDAAGVPCLIDYEEVGFHAPFTDYFHSIVQKCALTGMRVDMAAVLDRVDGVEGNANLWYLVYLVKSLERDLERRHLEGRHHRQLASLVQNKAKFLTEAVSSNY